jgi:protein-disulfide isomerase
MIVYRRERRFRLKKKHNHPKMSYSERRKLEQEKQRKQMRIMIWVTAVFVILLVGLIWLTANGSEGKPNAAVHNFSYEKLPVAGKPDAPVKIVEFGDFKCPSCQYFSQNVFPQLKKDYLDTGKAALYFMNFPFIDPDSTTAALAAQAVYHQNNDAFWTYYDAIYKNQGKEHVTWATPEFLVELAQKQGLNLDFERLKKDINDKTYKKEVDEQYAAGEKAGVSSTPTLFINGKEFVNFSDYNALKKAIEDAQKGTK